MSILDDFQTIESLQFSVRYGVTNSLTILLLVWADEPNLQALIQNLRENPEQESLTVERIQALAATEFEAGTWHPQDMAVSAYLYVLEQVENRDALQQATEDVLSTHGFYWANKLAQKIVTEKLQNLPQKP